ncbi:30S ribosomal protein S2 [Patescibacteria group bacterium]|nr:30S ribosomal protein S2 [Patescibacteria group bacterium]
MLNIEDKDKVVEMAQFGIFYGHKKTKTHPKMKNFIGGRRNEVELIDPEATVQSFNKAAAFLKEKIQNGGLILFVGTQAPAKEAIKSVAEDLKMPFVDFRWLGGTMTNFSIIKKRLDHYESLKAKREAGELSKYTKKEQTQFSKEIGKLSRNFEGLKNLVRLPDAVFLVDSVIHKTAVAEANKLGIPLVALIDTDDNPEPIQYPILCNDHAKSSISWIISALKEEVK